MTTLENLVSVKLTDKEIDTIKKSLQTINDTLAPHGVALTNTERRRLPKMSDKSLPFVEKSLQYAEKHPTLVPAFVNVPEFKIDVQAAQVLRDLMQDARQVCDLLDDTTLMAGSEAYVAALAFYNSVKMGTRMNVPTARPIYEDLKQRFENQGPKKEDATES